MIELIEDYANEDIERVFHESPVKDSPLWKYGLLMLVRNPVGIWVGFVGWMLNCSTHLLSGLIQLVSDGSSEIGRKTTSKTPCYLGAESISGKYGVELESVDVSPVDRVNMTPVYTSVLSWISIFWLVISVFAIPTRGIFALTSAIGMLLFGGFAKKQAGDYKRKPRNEHMYSRISRSCCENSCSNVALITGQKHVEGVAARADTDGVEYETYWLADVADLKEIDSTAD